MLTNNWLGIFNSGILGGSLPTGMVKSTTGLTSGEGYGLSGNITSYSPSFVIGTGTTPAKRTDYVLENPIDTSKYDQSVSRYCTASFETEQSSVKLMGAITNKSSETLSITEIGYMCKNSTQSYGKYYLLMRKVYTTPIVLEPGETKNIAINLF